MEREAGKLQNVARVVLTPPFRFGWNITSEGRKNIPKSGQAIIAPNHISVLDSFFVPLVVGRRMTYVGKAEYLDSWKTKYVFPAIGMIPIDRSGGDSSKRALDAAAQVLDSGELFGIYPEGTRSRDGQLHKGHTGVARLALRTGSPIIPTGIIGSDLIQPPDARFPRFFRRVHIRFGEPISVERYLDRADDRMVLRQITDEVMYAVRNLTGQAYIDTYAGKSSDTTAARQREGTVVPFPSRPDAQPAPATGHPETVVASAAAPAAKLPTHEDDGVERRSSAAAISSRPLDLGLDRELTIA